MFEIFSTSGRSDHLVASRNRWVNYQKERVEQQERLQMSAKKDCDQGVLAGQHVTGLQEESQRLPKEVVRSLFIATTFSNVRKDEKSITVKRKAVEVQSAPELVVVV